MTQKEIIMKSEIGLHFGPAAKFAKVAAQYESSLTVEVRGRKCNGEALLGLMSLCITHGDVMLLTAEGPDEQELIEALDKLNESKYE